uniref:Uncharacterized protein n=1 Tax=Drosophila melanogaster TaxID=7227 RepID=Q9VJX1_DROME|nr:uncharacterized protein Dmel_CG9263 [Drosophila melanogaster]AAF53315.1 uncharacterized protein Dmel_CG9263 [Drosophila melanogaster]|eukprot:NP_609662.1 uncharacterized protein Dmel_CG9263 [Drosophila melanogaster]
MACREPPQTAIVINLLIGDLVQDAVNEPRKLSEQKNTCQRLFDILGFQADECFEDLEDSDPAATHSSITVRTNSKSNLGGANKRNWYGWMSKALAEENSEDDVEIFRKKDSDVLKDIHSIGVQTEQPRRRIRVCPVDFAPALAPCESTRHTIFIDAVSMQIPNALGRPPLADRFCYMLTDFASALYCSLAIMCCCTPNMLR